jgi:pyruvate kinase
MKRRAKIVCTLGPATATREAVERLMHRGMDVARLNFSHGTHESHRAMVALVREAAERLGRPVAILQDLQGIKIRTGPISGGAVELRRGRTVRLVPGSSTGTAERFSITYPHLVRDVGDAARILIDDGLIRLEVTGRERGALIARVVEGGTLRDRKGVNLPGVRIRARAFTKKDRADLALGLSLGVDYVAVSFVRDAGDMKKVRAALGGAEIPLIAKIEKPEAIEQIDAILRVADGLMVARGDLGVEVSPEDVPVLQKMLIEKANRAGKTVITATQMLESMTAHTTPTRAEVTDVANAVIDGSDALMLSAETSTGMYPHRAVAMMDSIIRRTELAYRPAFLYEQGRSFSEAAAEAAADAAEDIGARYIVAFTQSGFTARLLSKFKPRVPIVAFTPLEHVRRRLALYWGVTPILVRPLASTDDVFADVERALIEKKMVARGDRIVITAGTPIGRAGTTNLIKFHTIGS